MRVPERLEPLLDHGVIEDVLRPLQSGKEAEVYLVICGGKECVAKVYKNAQHRSFQHRAEYTEGRRVRSSRQQRAMKKGSRHGRAKTEEAWRSAEVDAIQLLRGADVRVPEPIAYTDGVLVMELVRGYDGQPAPRLVDTHFTPEEAVEVFHFLLREVVKMLCAGLVHADLSDFNVLMSADGPVIIDFPQAIDPSSNQNASKLLIRDVKNLTSFLGRFAPELRRTQYGPEMWDLYERSELYPDSELTGKYESKKTDRAKVNSLLEDILEMEKQSRERREALGLPPPRRKRIPLPIEEQTKPRGGWGPGPRPKPKPKPKAPSATAKAPSKDEGSEERPEGRRRNRRGRKRGGGAPADGGGGNAQQQGRTRDGGGGNPPQARADRPPAGPGGDAPGSPDAPKRRRRRRRRGGSTGDAGPSGGRPPNPSSAPAPARPPAAAAPTGDAPPKKRRRRRRRRGGGGGGGESTPGNTDKS
jgi:RIO kinase 1